MAFIPYFREKISRMSRTDIRALVTRDGILAIFVRFKPNAADPAEQS